jgi:hypothetical protein
MLYFILYMILGTLTFVLSFYFESREIGEREGEIDPESALTPPMAIGCMILWPVVVVGYILYRVVKKIRNICIYLAKLGYKHGKPKHD